MAKSVAKNALYSGIRTISFMVFPLITYPYVTRVLMAENLGRIDFVISLISYFLLISALGIDTYATRTGSGLRDNQEQLDTFASEVFTINVVSTVIAYTLLALLVVLWPHLHGYALLIAIQSVTIVGTTFGVEWVYTLEEDFGYIMARALLVQVVSAILLFTLVRQPSDYVIYAAILVFSWVGGNVCNWFRAKRYTTIRLVWHFDWRRHLRPMLVLFGNALAVAIYVNIDISLLNVMRGDYEVGIYGLSVKVYRMVKQLLNAIVMVSLPRLSRYVAQKNTQDYHELLHNVAHGLLVIVAPALLLLGLLSTEVILIIGGDEFVAGSISLQILCFACFFAVWGTFFSNGVLLPYGQERLVLRSAIVGAIVNLVLNLAFIPLMGYVGAALTTIIAEFCVTCAVARFSSGFANLRSLAQRLAPSVLTALMGMGLMTLAHFGIETLKLPWLISFFVQGASLALIYALVLIARKDSLALHALDVAKQKLAGAHHEH